MSDVFTPGSKAKFSLQRRKLILDQPDFSSLDQPQLIVAVDAEEDFDWSRPFSSESRAVHSMQRQHLAQTILERHGITPIYLCDFPVADHEAGYRVLREWVADGKCTVGAQLHPWVNPPVTEVVNQHNSYPNNLPFDLAREKLRILTERIEENIGVRPCVYKAGRSGADQNLASLLKPLGYKVDMSFNPVRDYRHQGGPDHMIYPHTPFWLDPEHELLSIPQTADVVGVLSSYWLRLANTIWSEHAERLRVPGVLSRLGLLNRIVLTPEGVPLDEAKQLTRALWESGQRVFYLGYHSPSLMPGSTPYVRNTADLDCFLEWIDDYLSFFREELGGVGTAPVELHERAQKTSPVGTALPCTQAPLRHKSARAFTPQKQQDVIVLDFLSHENMHHAFNEGYIRTLRNAFPNDRIVFYADSGHVERLAQRLADVPNLILRTCDLFQVPFGLSRHNPIAGHWAAKRCLQTIKREVAGKPLRMLAVLGVDANLYAVIGRGWGAYSKVPMHMILHGQLGEAMIWRSRNPFIRANDFVAQLARPLPAGIMLVALELGVKEAIVEIAPAMGSSIHVLEHPVLVSEWSAQQDLTGSAGALQIAFLGHARSAKGFHTFNEIANRVKRPDIEFQAIGLASVETAHLDMSGLIRQPSQEAMPRDEYRAALARADLVCLPLHSRAYDFTASGTVSDAIAALKPVLSLRNRPLEAIVARYGPIGYLVDSEEEMFKLIEELDVADFVARKPEWIANLAKIREARRPEILGRTYAVPATAASATARAALS